MKSGRDSESRFAGMVMVGLVLAAALTLGVVLAPVTVDAGGEAEDFGTPGIEAPPTPEIDEQIL